MKIELTLLIQAKRPIPGTELSTEYLESSAAVTVSGKTKDCLKIVAMLKRKYGKENVV